MTHSPSHEPTAPARRPGRYRNNQRILRGAPPGLSLVSTLQRQRLLSRDRLMLAAAELLLTFSIPTTDSGMRMLPLPSVEDMFMRRLFEHAAYGLYKHKLEPQGWTVTHGRRQNWQTADETPGMMSILPAMQLDIVLDSPATDITSRRLVIDTKFTSITKPGHYRTATLESGYVYQIYSYLVSQDRHGQQNQSEGLMLHPSVGEHVDEEVVIQGHRIRFATVDLTAQSGKFADGFISAISAARLPESVLAAPIIDPSR